MGSKNNLFLFIDYRPVFPPEIRSHGPEEEGQDLGTLYVQDFHNDYKHNTDAKFYKM